MSRYVALGSSMAAGPGIRPPAAGAPFGSGRSARNYPHLLAQRCGFELFDVTFSGATTAHVLDERQRGAPPQIDVLDGTEAVVTITIGGNDVGYVPLLMAAALPGPARWLPVVRDLLDRQAREDALAGIDDALCAVGSAVRAKAPRARVIFVDYLTLLPPAGVSAPPLSEDELALGRLIAERLEQATAVAAEQTGCELVSAAQASRDHHAWSSDPWTTAAGWPLPWRPAPFHPNPAGMRAVAELLAARVDRA